MRRMVQRPSAGSVARTGADELATVRSMTTPRARHAARLRASRRRAQARARWFVLTVAIAVLGVITLAVTAFGNDRSGGSPLSAAPASAPVTSAPPEPPALGPGRAAG